jgi:hypothetical protein
MAAPRHLTGRLRQNRFRIALVFFIGLVLAIWPLTTWLGDPARATRPFRIGYQSSPRIRVAEDNRVNQRIVNRMLQKLGCTVDVAQNGNVAVQMALATPYDLILMDYHMPEMNGSDATKAIRAATPADKHTPIPCAHCQCVGMGAETLP